MSTDFDSFFNNIGGKAMQFILIFGILLNAITLVAAASGAEQSFINALPTIFGLGWVYSSTSQLATAIMSQTSILSTIITITMILNSILSILASIVSVLVAGYLALAAFIISSIPSQVMPIAVFIAVGLTFIQFCVWYSLAKLTINILSNFFQRTF
ncbi:MAG: hypothetical protein QXK24_01285 [Ignisphaera sp.]